jgi:hypothetical protein
LSLIQFQLENDPDLTTQVYQRHAEPLRQLTELGFRSLCVYSERTPALSLLWLAPIYFTMRNARELVRLRPNLGFQTCYLLATHTDPTAFALVNALNAKFYTGFSDRSLTVTVQRTIPRRATPDAPESPIVRGQRERKVFRLEVTDSIEGAWALHCERVEQYRQATGAQPQAALRFEDYVRLSEQESTPGELIRTLATIYALTVLPVCLFLGVVLFWFFYFSNRLR